MARIRSIRHHADPRPQQGFISVGFGDFHWPVHDWLGDRHYPERQCFERRRVKLCYNAGADTTGYEGDFYCVAARLDADTGSVQLLAAVGPSRISPTATLHFVNFLGISGIPSTTEGDKQFKCLEAGTWKNMACHLESNGFNRATTVTNRINNSNGSMAISIPASTSGSFEDQSGSDTVSSDDLLDYGFILGSSLPGSGSFMMVWIGAHFFTSISSQCMIGGTASMATEILPVETYYCSLFGGGNPFRETMARATGLFPYALMASHYTNFVTDADMGNGAATLTLLKNGSASALAVTSRAGETGYIVDNSDTVAFDTGDTCANSIALASDAGTYIYWASAGLLLQALSP